MHKIENQFVKMLLTKVRDRETSKEVLRETLFKLGKYVASEVIGNEFVIEKDITTPLAQTYHGLYKLEQKIVVISTKDDYEFFAAGVSSELGDCISGYMDFAGVRGENALKSDMRTIVLPDEKKYEIVDTVIVAKSVLATGCTAISLLKKAVEKYDPNNLIVASVFYSEKGIRELKREMKRCKVYVCGQPDILNNEGLLLPGVGNLDERMKGLGG